MIDELDKVKYQVERRLRELGAAVVSHQRAQAESLVADAKQAPKEKTPIARLSFLTSQLRQAAQPSARQGLGQRRFCPPPLHQPPLHLHMRQKPELT